MKLEIIATNYSESKLIEEAKIDRIELVKDLPKGGLTPEFKTVEKIMRNINIDVAVMIRPHDKSFYYNKQEIDIMKQTAKVLEQIGVKHVVIGALNQEGIIDVKLMDEILLGTNLICTVHRAIDSSSDILASTIEINRFERAKSILTSGGIGNAFENIEVIVKVQELSNKEIIAGGGVNIQNMDYIYKRLDKDCYIHMGTAARDRCTMEITTESLNILKGALNEK